MKDTGQMMMLGTVEQDCLISPGLEWGNQSGKYLDISTRFEERHNMYNYGPSHHHNQHHHKKRKTPSPKPAPRRKRKDKSDRLENGLSEDDEGPGKENRPTSEVRSSVKQRIQQFEVDEEDSPESGKSSRQGSPSKPFHMFQTQGHIMAPAPGKLAKKDEYDYSDEEDIQIDGSDDMTSAGSSPISRPVPRPRGHKRRPHSSDGSLDEGLDSVHTSSQDSVHSTLDSDDSGFGSIQRANPTLTSFKRPAGPKNRRNPTRHSLRKGMSPDESGDMLDHIKESEQEMDTYDKGQDSTPDMMRNGDIDDSADDEEDEVMEDVNHNKPSISFLNIHHNGTTETTVHSPDKSPSSSRKPYVPPLDLSILHQHGDGSDPIPAEHGPSLAIHKAKSINEEDVMLSPRMSKLKKKAKPTTLSAHHDTDVPPSPPTEQSKFKNMNRSQDDDQSALVKQLTRKIQSCKRRIKGFEETFEIEHGYRPSQSDKASRPDIKKLMQELARARKELKRLKEEIHGSWERLDGQYDTSPRSSGQTDTASDDLNSPTVEETLDILHKRLQEKRRDAYRPQDLALMSRDQIQEEKLAVQKALLQYESLHGRPTTKDSKELMKPLYDRYRSIKRMLAKPLSPREKMKELESVPEDHAIEFPTPSTATARTPTRDVIKIPTSPSDEPPGEGTDFMITQNLGLLKETLKTVDRNAQPDRSPEGPGPSSWKANLHELTVPQLYEEQQRARVDKKRLRKLLREFEDNFFNEMGRKVQKEDRSPMEAEYQEYKQIKARLKLLDALLMKNDPTYT